MARGAYTIEFYEEDGRSPVERWMESDLTDVELAALLSALEHVLSHLGVGVCGTEWGKQLGGGLFEFRIRHTANEIRRMHGDPVKGGKPAERCCSASSVMRTAPRLCFSSTATTRAPIPVSAASSARSQ